MCHGILWFNTKHGLGCSRIKQSICCQRAGIWTWKVRTKNAQKVYSPFSGVIITQITYISHHHSCKENDAEVHQASWSTSLQSGNFLPHKIQKSNSSMTTTISRNKENVPWQVDKFFLFVLFHLLYGMMVDSVTKGLTTMNYESTFSFSFSFVFFYFLPFILFFFLVCL